MRSIVLIIFSLWTVAPVSAQSDQLRPSGTVPALDDCNLVSGHPDCHLDRMYEGRSVGISPRPVPEAPIHLYPADVPYHPVDRW